MTEPMGCGVINIKEMN